MSLYPDVARQFEKLIPVWLTLDSSANPNPANDAGLEIIALCEQIMKYDGFYHFGLIKALKCANSEKELVNIICNYFIPLVNWLRPSVLQEMANYKDFPTIDLSRQYIEPTTMEDENESFFYFPY